MDAEIPISVANTNASVDMGWKGGGCYVDVLVYSYITHSAEYTETGSQFSEHQPHYNTSNQ